MAFVDKLSQNEMSSNSGSTELVDKRKELQQREKQEATSQKKPWVSVLDTRVNEDDIKNGFFELDWNDHFIELLLDEGYAGETQEEMVEKWFNNIIRTLLEEEGIDTTEVKSGNVATFLKNE